MTLPPITDKQKQILFLLYKFRFITANQLYRYFQHKDPHRIKVWLKDLKEKGYIAADVDLSEVTKPYIYYLATNARHILKEDERFDEKYLNRIYKERTMTEVFKKHCLFIVEIYLYFLLRQEKNTKLIFCTQQDLTGYENLPDEIPDAYIEVETKKGTDRYFLELFDEYRSAAGIARFSVRKYVTFSEDGGWQANTGSESIPTLLFVLPDERRKKHIYHYGKAKLAKSFEEISLFLTTQDAVKFSKPEANIWSEVK